MYKLLLEDSFLSEVGVSFIQNNIGEPFSGPAFRTAMLARQDDNFKRDTSRIDSVYNQIMTIAQKKTNIYLWSTFPILENFPSSSFNKVTQVMKHQESLVYYCGDAWF